MPALVSTLCICIVFVPMFFLEGVSRYLFVPLAEAVVFAMLASYALSRTLVPTLAKYWLRAHGDVEVRQSPRGFWARLQAGFERGFDGLRRSYRRFLAIALLNRKAFAAGFIALTAASMLLTPYLGQDFFPAVDAGQIKLHLHAHAGTRIEETARLSDGVETEIRRLIPADEIQNMVDNIGLPVSGINLTYSNSAPTGPADADIMISLKPVHTPTADIIRTLRNRLPKAFPGVDFAFLPADMVGQILNFGLPAPINIQVVGANKAANRQYAVNLREKLAHIPGIVDLHIHQAADSPQLRVNVDRLRALDVGLTQRDIANNILISLSGSFQNTPNFWINPKNGVSYPVVVQTPQYQIDSLEALGNVSIAGTSSTQPQILGALGEFGRGIGPEVVTHYNIQPTIDIFAAVQDRDLGGVAAEIRRVLAETARDVPKGSTVVLRGQIATMESSYLSLYGGLVLSIVLVYLLIVVNFQSWLDAFIIITALPASLAGIVWMLFVTHTTLSVPALTGAIMCMGVATANSILVISFARERMEQGRKALRAALDGRLLPFQAGVDDGTGHDHRHGADGFGAGRRRRAERTAWPRGDWRFGLRHCRDPVLRSDDLLSCPQPPSKASAMSAGGSMLTRVPTRLPVRSGSKSRVLWSVGLTTCIVMALAAAGGIFLRQVAGARLADLTEDQAKTVVAVTKAKPGTANAELVLPGNVQALIELPIHARTSGYISSWLVDIGAPVKKGQLLAEIDTPEIDAQLNQAEADLAVADANEAIANTTAQRFQKLVLTASVSRQDADDKAAAAVAKTALVASAKANLDRLRHMVEFKHVVAPFDGVVTARRIDVGALINAGGGNGPELFRIADRTTLRVYVQVPQAYAPQVKIGTVAELRLAEYPGRTFAGKLVRTADAIEPVSRTLLAEFRLDNAQNQLLAGSYAEVHLKLSSPPGILRLPVNTLLFRSDGLRVAKADEQGRVSLAPIVLGRDFGTEVEVVDGVKPTDNIILNPPDSLAAGQIVHFAPPKTGAAK